MDDVKQKVAAQFGKTADAYVTSQGHARGGDLSRLPAWAELTGTERVLDVATGAGHTSFAMAPHAREVVGVDLTAAMVERAAAGSAERGITNTRYLVADVDRLPFESDSFDVITCRIAAHHFPDLEASVREMTRVLRPGGRLLIVDNFVPEEAELDRFINEVELLRDPSHVRAHPLSEWEAVFHSAGLGYTVAETYLTSVDFAEWVKASQTPPETETEIRHRLTSAIPAVAAHFRIELEPTMGFSLHKAILIGRKP